MILKAYFHKGRAIRKVGGGGGEFLSRRNFFSLSNSLYQFFLGHSQPSAQAFSAWSFLDSTTSCDVTERYSPALSQTSRGQRIKRERLGTKLGRSINIF